MGTDAAGLDEGRPVFDVFRYAATAAGREGSQSL